VILRLFLLIGAALAAVLRHSPPQSRDGRSREAPSVAGSDVPSPSVTPDGLARARRGRPREAAGTTPADHRFRPRDGDELELLIDGPAFFPRMLGDISRPPRPTSTSSSSASRRRDRHALPGPS
jgi:hypothetical protein